jgi:hypothetical protein
VIERTNRRGATSEELYAVNASHEPAADTPERPPADTQDQRATAQTLKERALALQPTQVLAWAVGSSIVLAIGSIAPWATATLFGVSVSASGLAGGGWATLITAIFGGIAVLNPEWLSRARWLQQRRVGIELIMLVVSFVVCVLNYADIDSYGLSGIVSPGWGLHLSLAACAVGAGTAHVLRLQARRASA